MALADKVKAVIQLPNVGLWATTAVLVVSTAAIYSNVVWTAVYIVVLLLSILGGIYLGLAFCLTLRGEKYNPKRKYGRATHVTTALLEEMRKRQVTGHFEKNVVISRNIDSIIEEILELLIRDFVMTWHHDLCSDTQKFPNAIREEFWAMSGKLYKAVQGVDMVDFMTKDVLSLLHLHFQHIRMATVREVTPKTPDKRRKFQLHKFLASEESELQFVRELSEILIVTLLPEKYVNAAAVKSLLIELLTCNVLKPAIDTMCDPDVINQSLYNWLDYRERLVLATKSTYTYAATYEAFMEMLERCNDIEHLIQIRLNIISEIIQATAIQQYKRMKGQRARKESKPIGTKKGDLLRARNLSRYLNQLSVCKAYCEKRIYRLGGPAYKSYTNQEDLPQRTPVTQVLSFSTIMDTEEARNYFFKYLMQHGDEDLLKFWAALENLRMSPVKERHNRAVCIHETYLAHPGSILRLYLDKALLKRMENFMKGDSGPEAFYKAQEVIYKVLEDQHYSSFILSLLYRQYVTSTSDKDDGKAMEATNLQDVMSSDSLHSRKQSMDSDVGTDKIAEHSTYAQEKLKQLQHKIMNKSLALKALGQPHKTDYKIVKLLADMEDEVERLKTEQKQLEFHIDRTDVWVANMGHWTATLHSADLSEDKKDVHLVIVVHLDQEASQTHDRNHTAGWVVSRNMRDLQKLHQTAVQVCPELDSIKPKFRKLNDNLIKSIDQHFTAAKEELDAYMMTVLSDERLAFSETVFAFLSPSPEHLKHHKDSSKDKSSFGNFFRQLASPTKDEASDTDDELIFADEYEERRSAVQDSVATELYRLMGEVFSIQGVFKWFRKTFIAFVKISTGKSVNKQIRSTVEWMFSEPMMVYYLKWLKDTYWPNGQLAPPRSKRSEQEKLRVRLEAKDKLLNNMPEALKHLVGEKNAGQGTICIFEVFQEEMLNRHLCYSILLPLLLKLFPQISHCDRK